MRIAQCCDSLFPLATDMERAVHAYARIIGARGHESYIVAPLCETGCRAGLPYEIIDFLPMRMPGLARYRTGVAAMDRHYLARMELAGLDLVHAHSPGFSGLEAMRLASGRHIPLVGTFYGGYYDELLRATRSEAIATLALKYIVDFYGRCDEVWAVGEAAREELIRCGFHGRIALAPCGPAEGMDDASPAWENVLDEAIERYAALIELEKFRLTRKRGLFRRELSAMERSLDLRKAALMRRYLAWDAEGIYTYAHTPQHLLSEKVSPPLPRAAPEKMGLNPKSLLGLFHAVDADEEARAHAMLVLKDGHVVAEGYWTPYEKHVPHMLFSMSKSIVSTAIGMLADEEKLALNERLVDIFADKADDIEAHPLKDATVWHLLTMSTGARFDEIGSALTTDWAREFMESGTRFAPGAQFHYNSMNTYMLAAIVHRKAGVSVMEYLRPRLFAPLHIESAAWETCPMGVEKGGWGLSLSIEDAAKIGLLYLNGGVWRENGTQTRLISEAWIKEATRKQIDTPDGECTDGYGYQVWMAPRGAYLFNGAFGQYLLMLPGHGALVALFSGTARLFSQSGFMGAVEQCFEGEQGLLPAGPDDARRVDAMRDSLALSQNASARMLHAALQSLTCLNRQRLEETMPTPLKWLAAHFQGRFDFAPNHGGILPLVIQGIHNAFAQGIEALEISGQDGTLTITLHEGGDTHVLHASDGAFTRTAIEIRGEKYPASVGAICGITNEGHAVLRVYVYFLSTPCVRVITLRFEEGKLFVELDELPGANDAVLMLMELTGMTRWELFRAMMPLLQQEKLQHRLREFAVTRLEMKE